jgi:RNA methyltransferase, TrmH family
MAMLTRSTIKFIKSLQEKKYRKQEQCFIVEGAKSVQEVLASDFEVVLLVATADFLKSLESTLQSPKIVEAKQSELTTLGEFSTNDAALAVVRMRGNKHIKIPTDQFTIMLDDIRDPGNLGTIIRTADWYGISSIVASEETVDFYSPKVISSTKGSFTRVSFTYTNLLEILVSNKLPVFGAFLEGDDVHDVDFGNAGILVIGNESRGISMEVARYVTNRITIPRYGKAESLNAAIATSIILDNMKR